MTDSYGPTLRPDSAPPHINIIRQFREELRLGRHEFAELLEINIDTLRVWESGSSKPRGPAALKLVAAAKRNGFPMTIEEIFAIEKPIRKVEKKPNGK